MAAPAGTTYVVARCREALEWLEPLRGERVVVYNKGDALPAGGVGDEVAAENVGREGDTYLRYIVAHYEALPEVCVFSQGRIDDHVGAWSAAGNAICQGRSFAAEPAAFLRCLAAQAAARGLSEPSEVFAAATRDVNWRRDFNRDYYGLPGAWFAADRYRDDARRPFDQWFEQHVGPYPVGTFRAHSCGLFAVRRDRVLRRSREFYEALRRELSWHVDPVEGHFLERSWHYVFALGDEPRAARAEAAPG